MVSAGTKKSTKSITSSRIIWFALASYSIEFTSNLLIGLFAELIDGQQQYAFNRNGSKLLNVLWLTKIHENAFSSTGNTE